MTIKPFSRAVGFEKALKRQKFEYSKTNDKNKTVSDHLSLLLSTKKTKERLVDDILGSEKNKFMEIVRMDSSKNSFNNDYHAGCLLVEIEPNPMVLADQGSLQSAIDWVQVRFFLILN